MEKGWLDSFKKAEKRKGINGTDKDGKEEKGLSLPACSSMTLTSAEGKPYWFRTCDIETDLWRDGAHIVYQKKGSPLVLSGSERGRLRYELMGISYNQEDSWLLDGINDGGLAGGLLMLPEATSVAVAESGLVGCMGMELVTLLLASCKNVEEVKAMAGDIQILDIPYKDTSVPASMHYFFVDEGGNEVILEAADGSRPGCLQVYEKDEGIGVMTNSPVYAKQLQNLSWFISQSPQLRQGLDGKAITGLDFQGRYIHADSQAEHLSLSGEFPGSYCSYDRFIRLAVFKALNNCGMDFMDEQMLALGGNLMNTVFEPSSKGIFHYSSMDKNGVIKGRKDSRTRYVVMYDLMGRRFSLRPMESIKWEEYSLGNKGVFA